MLWTLLLCECFIVYCYSEQSDRMRLWSVNNNKNKIMSNHNIYIIIFANASSIRIDFVPFPSRFGRFVSRLWRSPFLITFTSHLFLYDHIFPFLPGLERKKLKKGVKPRGLRCMQQCRIKFSSPAAAWLREKESALFSFKTNYFGDHNFSFGAN